MSNISESKGYTINDTKMYRNDVLNLPSHFDINYLKEAVELLALGQKLNSEYDYHPLKGRRAGKFCIHIPDPNAYIKDKSGNLNTYSDWQLFFDKDENRKVIVLEETGTHKYLRNKAKISGKKK